ncbi:hypothetical protein H072_8247 [Dactylellina haptotyla CBS 200.50]|uniref:Apple domain-containing protein n=1 Tax=Dactylellina haptotyla (strain CBS 200.50) TaxID=1284197 RepID=S8BS21_DACHA|nr:hypothetical protein H072_8247 [Dactylellina haptotyla CBS 200.50]
MRYLPFVTLLASLVAALPAPAEVGDDARLVDVSPSKLDARSVNMCSKIPVVFIVPILKALKATPFCSDFLHITPVRKTVTSVKGTVTSYTSTSTQINTENILTTQLFYETSDITTTTGTTYVPVTDIQSTTITAVLSTSTVTQTTVDSFVNVPTPTKTRTVTSIVFAHYVNKRDVEKRHIPVPSMLVKSASADISAACSCLGLPTPTITTTVTTTSTVYTVASTQSVSTVIQTSDVTTTITNYINVIDVETTTITVDQTSTVPSIAVTTIVVHATSTITPVASTVTSVVSTTVTTDPCDPTNGIKYLDEVYNSRGIFHTGYDVNKSVVSFGQIPLVECCRRCFATPGCVVGSTLIGGYGCYVLVNAITPVVGQSATCPSGLDYIDVFTGPSIGLPTVATQNGVFVLGPCYGTSS